MKAYRSKSGKPSGISGYQPGADYIIIRFGNSAVYKYTYTSAGKATVETMKKLAESQSGLSTYISQHDPPYSEKIY